MAAPPTPQLLDVTVRDGSYLINHKFSPERVADIAKGLQEAGVSYAEIGHGMGIGASLMGFPAIADDETLLAAAKRAAPALKLCVFISPFDVALPIIPGLVEYFEIGRVGLPVHGVATGAKFIQKLKKYGKTASVQLVGSHTRPPETAAQSAKEAQALGADIVYVVDTFGSMMPSEVRDYVSAVRAGVQIAVGFHGHNNSGLAIPNTLAAWEAGATWLDASLMGVGRGAGNAGLEILAQQLQIRGHLEEIQLKKLCHAAESAALPLFSSPPVSRYIDLLFAQEKLDYTPSDFLELCANRIGVSLEDFLMQIHNKMAADISVSDSHLAAVLAEYGLDFHELIASLKNG